MEIRNELETIEAQEAHEKRMALENSINHAGNVWGHSPTGLEGKRAAMAMLSTKTGLYAKVPITCKAHNCPYAETCALLQHGLAPYGEPCSWETALIETKYAQYMKDYDLDNSSYTDNTMVSELINLDIKLERQKSLIAAEGVSIVDVVAGITESGEQFTRPEISKAEELYNITLNQKLKLLDKLLGTRQSQKGLQGSNKSFAEMLEEAMAQDDFIIEERPENIQ